MTVQAPVPEQRWVELREEMVARQLAVRGIRDPRVLRAMRDVPRHRFIPAPQEGTAYGDHPVLIGEGQTISQPYIVAEMTALALTATPAPRRVLDVGTGSGYQAAILAQLGLDVVSIERLPALADRAWKTLAEAGYERVQVRTGDGVYGLRRALVLAGAQTQLASLWKVADVATRDLMVDYYRRLLDGEGRSGALRAAQQAMIASPGRQHPYYWAAFVPIGNWTALPPAR